jgi:hypothetical protein
MKIIKRVINTIVEKMDKMYVANRSILTLEKAPRADIDVHDPDATLKVTDYPTVKIKELYERFIALEEKVNKDIAEIKDAIVAIVAIVAIKQNK